MSTIFERLNAAFVRFMPNADNLDYEARLSLRDIRDASDEITRLTARIADLEKALRDVAEAKMPGLARYIARTTLEASERGENP